VTSKPYSAKQGQYLAFIFYYTKIHGVAPAEADMERYFKEALRAGADGYLLKDGPARHLLDAMSFVRDGGVYVSPLLRGAGLFTRTEKSPSDDSVGSLSPREMEVFSYLVNGLRPKDIAELLEISPKTVDTYRASLMRKLNVHDLVGLVKFAIERNLTSTSDQRGRQ
jgi:DNA-binding NarL/FixJ family response regulator